MAGSINPPINEVPRKRSGEIYVGLNKSPYSDGWLRLPLVAAFDFDGVIAENSSEWVLREFGLEDYIEHERKFSDVPLNPGPVCNFARRLFALKRYLRLVTGEELVRLYLITARSHKVAGRVFRTLEKCGLEFDRVFLLAGAPKRKVLEMVKPHIFIDDHIENMDWFEDGFVMKLRIS